MEKLKIEYVPIDTLTPYDHNAKIHTPEQVDQIKESIQEFGMNDPIAVWGKDNLIIEGHGRLMACKELGMKEVPIIRLDGLTDEQRRAYTLVHNQTTMTTGFDLDILNEELEKIDSIDMSGFGFDEINTDDMDIKEDDFDIEDEVKEEPKSKRGQIYKLGNHILMCGDSTDPDDVRTLMQGELADMVVTDPPYNVNVENEKGMTIENDNLGSDEFRQFLQSAFRNLSDNLKEGGAFYIWYGDKEDIAFRNACFDNGLTIKQCLIWVKNAFVLGRQDYQWRHEPCLYGWKDGASHYFIDDRRQSTIIEDKIDFDKLKKEEAIEMLKEIYNDGIASTIIHENKPIADDLHPTMKPVKLIARQVANSSKRGEKVLDLFGGSGTTMLACEQLERKCYMMEYDPTYVDAIVKRWEQFTGSKAKLISGGEKND